MDRKYVFRHFVPPLWNLPPKEDLGQFLLQVQIHEMKQIGFTQGKDGKYRIIFNTEKFNPFLEFSKIIPIEEGNPLRDRPLVVLIRTDAHEMTEEEAKIMENMMTYQKQEGSIKPYRAFLTPGEHERVSTFLRAVPHQSLLSPWMTEYSNQFAILQNAYLDPLRIACFLHNVIYFLHPKYQGVEETAQLLGNMYLNAHMMVPFPFAGPTQAAIDYRSAVATDMKLMSDQMVESDDPPQVVATNLYEYMKKRNALKPCYKCGTINAPLLCGRCKAIRYCGKECQKDHYDLHVLWCKDNAVKEK